MMSWPSIATGRVIAWIGNGATMPTALSASMMRGSVPSSAQLIAGAGAGAAGSGSVNGAESVAGAADAGWGTDSTAVDAVSAGESPESASSSGASLAGEADTRCLTEQERASSRT